MSEHRQVSHGRGGAGNMSDPHSAHVTSSSDLVTPTLKAERFTTGRGGSGNMVSNDDPEIARVRQDVGVPQPVRDSVDESVVRLGRGGAANVVRTVSHEDLEAEREPELEQEKDKDQAGSSTEEKTLKDRLHSTADQIRRKISHSPDTEGKP